MAVTDVFFMAYVYPNRALTRARFSTNFWLDTFALKHEHSAMIDQTIDLITRYVASGAESKNGFAARAGVGEATLRKLGAADWNPTADTLRKLEAALPADFARLSSDEAA
mgnify:FL=1